MKHLLESLLDGGNDGGGHGVDPLVQLITNGLITRIKHLVELSTKGLITRIKQLVERIEGHWQGGGAGLMGSGSQGKGSGDRAFSSRSRRCRDSSFFMNLMGRRVSLHKVNMLRSGGFRHMCEIKGTLDAFFLI